jgi:hypothetical protein
VEKQTSTVKNITVNAATSTVVSKIQPTGEWYNFTNKTVGVFTGEYGAKGNYITGITSGTPEYIAGTKLKTLRAENDGISLGSTMSFLNAATDGISVFVRMKPLEIDTNCYMFGQSSGNHFFVAAINAANKLQVLTKMGTTTLAVNTSDAAVFSGAGPYPVKDFFIEIDKATGVVKFYDGVTEIPSTGDVLSSITAYNPTTVWALGGRNNTGFDTVADISAEFEHVIINPQLFTGTEKQFIIDNV